MAGASLVPGNVSVEPKKAFNVPPTGWSTVQSSNPSE
jgi:hypothetical protein